MLRSSLSTLAVLAVAATAVGFSTAPAFAAPADANYPVHEHPAPDTDKGGHDDNGDDDGDDD